MDSWPSRRHVRRTGALGLIDNMKWFGACFVELWSAYRLYSTHSGWLAGVGVEALLEADWRLSRFAHVHMWHFFRSGKPRQGVSCGSLVGKVACPRGDSVWGTTVLVLRRILRTSKESRFGPSGFDVGHRSSLLRARGGVSRHEGSRPLGTPVVWWKRCISCGGKRIIGRRGTGIR